MWKDNWPPQRIRQSERVFFFNISTEAMSTSANFYKVCCHLEAQSPPRAINIFKSKIPHDVIRAAVSREPQCQIQIQLDTVGIKIHRRDGRDHKAKAEETAGATKHFRVKECCNYTCRLTLGLPCGQRGLRSLGDNYLAGKQRWKDNHTLVGADVVGMTPRPHLLQRDCLT